MTYFKLYFDLLDNIEALEMAERGRLLTAILEYGITGAAPRLTGNERFVFPFLKSQYDRDEAAYRAEEATAAEKEAAVSAARREAGRKGGSKPKQTEANGSKRKQTEANGSKPKQTEANGSEKDKDKDKEEDKDKDYTKDEREARARVGPTLDEITAYCRERKSRVNPQRFFAYYDDKGWDGVSDWRKRIAAWEQNGIDKPDLHDSPASYDIERAEQKARTTVPELRKRGSQ